MAEPISDLERVAREFRRELLAHERQAAREMVDAYGTVWRRLKVGLDGLTAEISAARERGELPDVHHPRVAGAPPSARTPGTFSPSWLYRQERYRQLMAEVEREMAGFARWAAPRIAGGEAAAIEMASDHSRDLVRASAGDVPRVVAQWTRLPSDATADLVGHLHDGSPLADLLAELGPEASAAVRDDLIAGLATGQGPREIARLVRRDVGMSLVRALRISRTEVLRAYREATHRNYEANSNIVKGWIWHSALDRRTCMSCIAMHGTFHRLDERLDDHPNGRCSPLPVTKTWAELGIEGVEEVRRPVETGAAWFARQPEAVQLAMMGPAKYVAWKAGAFDLKDLTGRKRSPRWGTHRYERSLKEILGTDEALKWRLRILKATGGQGGGPGGTGTGNPGGPTGQGRTPVSAAIVVPRGAGSAPITRALAIIDSVHEDGQLPSIPAVRTAAHSFHAQYRHRTSGAPVDIRVSTFSSHPELSFAHEIGHFLDHHGMGAPGIFASQHDQALANWRSAVDRSSAIMRLRSLSTQPFAQIQGGLSGPVTIPVDQRHLAYLLTREETFARSYAQYIATKSADPLLMQQLNGIRSNQADLYRWRQWEDGDFLSIMQAMDDLFGALGWI